VANGVAGRQMAEFLGHVLNVVTGVIQRIGHGEHVQALRPLKYLSVFRVASRLTAVSL
jgi:hypothetical protein